MVPRIATLMCLPCAEALQRHAGVRMAKAISTADKALEVVCTKSSPAYDSITAACVAKHARKTMQQDASAPERAKLLDGDPEVAIRLAASRLKKLYFSLSEQNVHGGTPQVVSVQDMSDAEAGLLRCIAHLLEVQIEGSVEAAFHAEQGSADASVHA